MITLQFKIQVIRRDGTDNLITESAWPFGLRVPVVGDGISITRQDQTTISGLVKAVDFLITDGEDPQIRIHL